MSVTSRAASVGGNTTGVSLTSTAGTEVIVTTVHGYRVVVRRVGESEHEA